MQNVVQNKILELCDYYKVFEFGDARIALMCNDKRREYNYMFGFWKYSDNTRDNEWVFDEMEEHCRRLNVKALIGPMNYATWFEYRIAVDNFDFNVYPDIAGSIEQSNFLIRRGYEAKWKYFSTLFEPDYDSLILKKKVDLGPEFEIIKEFRAVTEASTSAVYEISLDCFSEAAFYSPIDYKAYNEIYLEALSGISPNIILIKYKDEPIAFAFGYENTDKKFYVSKTLGIKKKFQNSSIILKLSQEMLNMPVRYNQKHAVYHFQSEETFKRIMKDGPKKIKNYSLFCKEL